MIIRRLCPAKINLFLHLVRQREDGYHELQTAFVLLDWGDQLTIEVTGPPPRAGDLTIDHITINPIHNIQQDKNSVFQAVQAYTFALQRALPQMTIHIDKLIPMGAGLGGGSSNAAATLLALNEIMKSPLTLDTLTRIGLSLGADVPVFIRQSHAWAEGVGEKLQPLRIKPLYVLLAFPEASINTHQAFQSPDLQRTHPPIPFVSAMSLSDVKHNHFEPIARSLSPEIDACFKHLERYGNPRLSGTGACVFLAFHDKTTAQHTIRHIILDKPQFQLQFATSCSLA